MMETSAYEQEREANIARNRALLEQLELKDAVASLGVPIKHKHPPKPKPKPAPAAKRVKREREEAPRRQSARLRKLDDLDPNETPAQKRRRLAKAEERRKEEEEERELAEEQRQLAQRPRAQDLDLDVLTTESDEKLPDEEMSVLKGVLQATTQKPIARAVGSVDAWVYENDKHDEREAQELRKRLGKMKVVSSKTRVTNNRVYCAIYHPEPTKDLIFFGDKHGQLGIWDARAPAEEVADEDDDVTSKEPLEGKHWQLQLHWPATAKSSISSIKIDPTDSHSLYSTSYDCTIRQFSFVSGISRQVYFSPDVLLTSLELIPSGHEMWVSDAAGGVTHLDLREGPGHARWYGLSDKKIGSVSINPTSPHLILTASNSRYIKIWDARKLDVLATSKHKRGASPSPPSPTRSSPVPLEFDSDRIQEFVASKKGSGVLRGEHAHGKSPTSAYWDPRGRSIISTSYDDTLRIWELDAGKYDDSPVFPALAPFSRIRHNCQTGRWLTPLRAVWTPNPDVYPHFTVGNLDHSLQIFSCKGDLVAKLSDPTITATQSVTCSHPSVVERCATGNGSGRCILWAPPDV